jgi:hypothetical protein
MHVVSCVAIDPLVAPLCAPFRGVLKHQRGQRPQISDSEQICYQVMSA